MKVQFPAPEVAYVEDYCQTTLRFARFLSFGVDGGQRDEIQLYWSLRGFGARAGLESCPRSNGSFVV